MAAAECRVSALNSEHDTVMSRAEKAESTLSMLKSDLERVTTCKKQETELLARKVISLCKIYHNNETQNKIFVILCTLE